MDQNLEAVRRLVEQLEGGQTKPTNSQPDAVEQILEASTVASANELGTVEAEDETGNPFAFGRLAAERDQVGLPKNHPSYVKRSCKTCYGRGYRVVSAGVRLHDDGRKTKTPGTRYVACTCVENGYKRALVELGRLVRSELKFAKDNGEEITPDFEAKIRTSCVDMALTMIEG